MALESTGQPRKRRTAHSIHCCRPHRRPTRHDANKRSRSCTMACSGEAPRIGDKLTQRTRRDGPLQGAKQTDSAAQTPKPAHRAPTAQSNASMNGHMQTYNLHNIRLDPRKIPLSPQPLRYLGIIRLLRSMGVEDTQGSKKAKPSRTSF